MGVPLAVAFAEAGDDVVGVDVDHARVTRAERRAARRSRTSPTSGWRRSLDRAALQHALRRPARGRGDPRLRPDAADAQPRAGPRAAAAPPHAGWPASSGATRSSCSSRRASPARRASTWCRCSRSPGCARARTSRSPTRPSGSIPGAPTTRRARRRRSSAGSRRAAPSARRRSTRDIVDEIVPVSTPEVAELSKLLENIFRSVNIALVNELAILADRMGIDIWEVVDAAATKPYGFMRFDRGRGWAGTASRSTRSTSPGRRASTTSSIGVHRAGRQGQPGAAVLLRAEDRAGAERGGQAGQGLADPAPRRVLQGGRRGSARVAGAADPRAAARPGRRGLLPRPARARAGRARAAERRRWTRRWRASTSR